MGEHEARSFETEAKVHGVDVTAIGSIVSGDGRVLAIGAEGRALEPGPTGYTHF